MKKLHRERAIEIAGFQVRVRVPERTAARIAASRSYRYALRPAAKRAYHMLRWVTGRRPRAGRAQVAYITATPPTPADLNREAIAVIQRVAPLDWHQSIHVGHGVITPGRVNHYKHLWSYRLPESLAGMRCLDVAPRDGFWTFEMARRGAAEVVSLDLDGPEAEQDRENFNVAAELLGYKPIVRRADLYDLDTAGLGRFDLVVMSDHLHRLRDPQRVLENLYPLCSGRLVLAALHEPRLERYGDANLSEFVAEGPRTERWWLLNVNTMRAMLAVAGFAPVEEVGRFSGDLGATVVLRCTASPQNPWQAFLPMATSENGEHASANGNGATPHAQPGVSGPVAKKLEFAGAEFVVVAHGRRADRLARSGMYRRVVRPILNLFGGRPKHTSASNGHAKEVEVANSTTPIADPATNGLAAKVTSIPWYHTIDLGGGVVTPGFVDHRDQLSSYQLPDSLAGKRCLDVATFDGYWAFELERRGAAEVVATDIADGLDCDLPRLMREAAENHRQPAPMGHGFRIASKALGSHVKHQICSVYDLSPERVGTFDFVYLGDLLLHLRDPQTALIAIGSVCHGEIHMAEVYDPAVEDFAPRSISRYSPWLPSFTWWLPSTNTLKAMLRVAGFTEIRELGRVLLKTRDGEAAKVIYRATGPAEATRHNDNLVLKEVG